MTETTETRRAEPRIFGHGLRWWRDFAAYRLRVRQCRHSLYSYSDSRRRKRPDGEPESYSRCHVCLRVLWRAWKP
jgi:hypothetical protein